MSNRARPVLLYNIIDTDDPLVALWNSEARTLTVVMGELHHAPLNSTGPGEIFKWKTRYNPLEVSADGERRFGWCEWEDGVQLNFFSVPEEPFHLVDLG